MSRPVGSKNKLSAGAKENITAVFTRLGGTAAMADWANDNKTEFYRIYSKMLPTENRIGNTDGSPLNLSWPLHQTTLDRQ